MKNLVALIIALAITIGFALISSYSIYKQDLRLCMKEASRSVCEEKLK